LHPHGQAANHTADDTDEGPTVPALDEPPIQTPPPTPAEPAPVPAVGEKSTPTLVAQIADDAGNLLTQHASLLQAEVRDGVRQAGGLFAALIAGGVMVLLGILFTAFAGVYGLQEATHLPLWACWLIVGGSLLVLGGIAAVVGGLGLTKINFVPTRTIKSLSETWSWLVKRSK
jgi:hypothetical protein